MLQFATNKNGEAILKVTKDGKVIEAKPGFVEVPEEQKHEQHFIAGSPEDMAAIFFGGKIPFKDYDDCVDDDIDDDLCALCSNSDW